MKGELVWYKEKKIVSKKKREGEEGLNGVKEKKKGGRRIRSRKRGLEEGRKVIKIKKWNRMRIRKEEGS